MLNATDLDVSCYGSNLRVELGGGDYYEGEMARGKFHGKGKLVMTSLGLEYEGEWLNNMRHGRGTETWKDGRSFSGEFLEDFKHYGEFSFPDGTNYNGSFLKNEFSGFGVLSSPGKYHYSGGFMDGLKHGKGKITFDNGDYYDGDFYKGKKHGKGIFYWMSEEKTYEGDWYNDKPHGIGFLSEYGYQKVRALFQDGKQEALL